MLSRIVIFRHIVTRSGNSRRTRPRSGFQARGISTVGRVGAAPVTVPIGESWVFRKAGPEQQPKRCSKKPAIFAEPP
jgi:hypothetical protein